MLEFLFAFAMFFSEKYKGKTMKKLLLIALFVLFLAPALSAAETRFIVETMPVAWIFGANLGAEAGIGPVSLTADIHHTGPESPLIVSYGNDDGFIMRGLTAGAGCMFYPGYVSGSNEGWYVGCKGLYGTFSMKVIDKTNSLDEYTIGKTSLTGIGGMVMTGYRIAQDNFQFRVGLHIGGMYPVQMHSSSYRTRNDAADDTQRKKRMELISIAVMNMPTAGFELAVGYSL